MTDTNKNSVDFDALANAGLEQYMQLKKKPAPVSAPKDQQGLGADMVDAFQRGVYQGVAGLGETGETFLGVGGGLRDIANAKADAQFETMSDAGKAALNKPLFAENEKGQLMFGDGAGDASTWMLNIANVAGQYVDMVAGGAGLARAGLKFGAKVVAKSEVKRALAAGASKEAAELSAKKAVQEFTVKHASKANIGSFTVLGGAIAGGQAGIQARDEVLNLDDSTLDESEAFRREYWTLNASHPELSVAERRTLAKRTLADSAADSVQRDPMLLASNLLTEAVGGKFLDGLVRGIGTGSRTLNGVKGFATEGATEAVQGGVEQYAINTAVQAHGDEQRDLMAGVKANAAMEGVMGGVIGGAGGLVRKGREEEKPVAAPVVGSADNFQATETPADNLAVEQEVQASPDVRQTESVRGKYKGIDDDILIAERMGFVEEATRLRNSKELFKRANEHEAQGNNELAAKIRTRGMDIYKSIMEVVEPEYKGGLPAEYYFDEYVPASHLPAAMGNPQTGNIYDAEAEAAQVGIGADRYGALPHKTGYALPESVDAPWYMDTTAEAKAAKAKTESAFTEQQGIDPYRPELPPGAKPEGVVDYQKPVIEKKSEYELAADVSPAIDYAPESQIDAKAARLQSKIDAYQQAKIDAKLPEGLKDGRLLRSVYRTDLERKLESISKRDELPPEAVNPQRDDLLVAIAKLGGINKAAAVAEGIDPAQTNNRVNGIKPVFTHNGRSLDAMAEALSEHGYIDAGYTPNEVLEKVYAAMNGNKVMSNYHDFNASMNAEWFANGPQVVKNLGRVGMAKAIDKALKAEPLSKNQIEAVKYALDHLTGQREELAETEVRPLRQRMKLARDMKAGQVKLDDMIASELLEKINAQQMTNAEKAAAYEALKRNLEAELKAISQDEAAEYINELTDDVLDAVDAGGKPADILAIIKAAKGDEIALGLYLDDYVESGFKRIPKGAVTAREIWGDEYGERNESGSGAKSKGAAEAYEADGKPNADGKAPGEDITGKAEADTGEILTSYTEGDLQAKAEEGQRRQQQEAQAESKSKADAELPGFTLTGSDSHSDQAAARGQNDLFSEIRKTLEREAKISQSDNLSHISHSDALKIGDYLRKTMEPGPHTDLLAQRAIRASSLNANAESIKWAKDLLEEIHAEKAAESENATESKPSITSAISTVDSSLKPDELAKLRQGLRFENINDTYWDWVLSLTDAERDELFDPEQTTNTGRNSRLMEYILKKTPANAGVSVSGDSVSTNSEIDAAAHEAATSPKNDKPEPSQAQKEAGNYEKGHITLHGLDISIENPRGSVRSGMSPDGKKWSNTMAHHYGYLKNTKGADGEQIDVFIGKNPESENVFIVDQVNPDGSFDEHKVMLGFKNHGMAVTGYKANYSKGWKVGKVTQMTMAEFKQWLANGDTRAPVAEQKADIKKAPRLSGTHFNDDVAMDDAGEVDSAADVQPALEDAGADKKTATPVKMEPTWGSYVDFYNGLREGQGGIDDLKTAFSVMLDQGDKIQESLKALTVPVLRGMVGYTARPDARKPDLIEQLYERGLHSFLLLKKNPERTFVYGSDRAKVEREYKEKLRTIVNGMTADDLADFQRKAMARDEEDAKQQESVKAGMADPKTIDDYRNIIRAKKLEGMSFKEARMSLNPEQRAAFDILTATEDRTKRNYQAEKLATAVKTAGQPVGGRIVETKHTKYGHDLFVVQLSERVGRDDYDILSAGAKQLGGRYSYYRGAGAVNGFQFTTMESAEAFSKLVQGDSSAAQAQAKAVRDAFADDKTQTAAERLTEMASRLDERADAALSVNRKANTHRRANMAANAIAAAEDEKAMAQTMRNIAEGHKTGSVKFLDRVRQKTQVEFLRTLVKVAKYEHHKNKYQSYAEQERHKYDSVTPEAADFAEWPYYTAERNDIARMGRELEAVAGGRRIGEKLLKIADDVSDAYLKFAKENLHKVSRFTKSNGEIATFSTKAAALDAVWRSNLSGKSTPISLSRGEWRLVLSPQAAREEGIWDGDAAKHITLPNDIAAEAVAKVKELNAGKERVYLPYRLEVAHERLSKFSKLGIETAAEMRAAIREFIELQAAPKAPDKIKEMERAMIGRKNDGLDFFPTSEAVVADMIEAAEIEDGMSVLEPSAGMGHIAEAIRSSASIDPDVIELSADRRELLEAKGFNVVGHDFTEIKPRQFFTYGDVFKHKDGSIGVMGKSGGLGSGRVGLFPLDKSGKPDTSELKWVNRDDLEGIEKRGAFSGYDRIIMNPPFSKRRDAEHIQHAYDLLKPGGRLVAIMGEGVFFGSDKKAVDFRNWLESVGGTSEQLPENSFMDASLQVTTGVNARMVVINKAVMGENQNTEPVLASLSKPPAIERIWGEISKDDAAFKYSASDKKTLEGVFADVLSGPNAEEGIQVEFDPHMSLTDFKVWKVKQKDTGRFAMVFDDGKEVHLDVLAWGQGGGGSMLYNAVANYAFNTGRVFIGDPAGLSNVAGMTRRLEAMISSALKFGTTKHLAPHPKQITGNALVPGFEWVVGDDAGNLARMLEASYKTTIRQFPELESMRYNAEKGVFEEVIDGREYTEADFERLTKDKRSQGGSGSVQQRSGAGGRVGGAVTAGRTTLKRAVITHTFSRGTGEERSKLLERLSGQRPKLLSKILYSLDNKTPANAGVSVSGKPVLGERAEPDIALLSAMLLAMGGSTGNPSIPKYQRGWYATSKAQVDEWIAGIKRELNEDVQVVATYRDLPAELRISLLEAGRAGGVTALYHKSKMILIADRIESQQEAISKVLHEALGHHGVMTYLGADLEPTLKKIYTGLGRKAFEELAHTYALDLTSEEGRQEAVLEYIAHMAETGRKPSFVQRFIAAIRAALRNAFPSIRLAWSDLDILALIDKSRITMRNGTLQGSGGADPLMSLKPNAKQADDYRSALAEVMESKKTNVQPVSLGRTPKVLRMAGAPDADLLISRDTVRKAVNGIKHNVPMSIIENLPELLASPIAVFDSKTEAGAVVVLVDGVDGNGDPVVVPIHLNKSVGRNALVINHIASVYGKEGDEWFAKQELLYLDENKKAESVRLMRVQFPASGSPTRLSGKKILTPDDIVNDAPLASLSARKATAEHFSDLNEDQAAFLNKIGRPTIKQAAVHRLREVVQNFGMKMRQGMIDRYAALLELDKAAHGENVVSQKTTASAWVRARLSNAASGAVSAMMSAGRLYLDKEGVIDVKDNGSSLMMALSKLGGSAEVERFMGWIAANRAAKLASEGRENLFSDDEIAAGIKLNGGALADGRTRADVYEEVFAEFQQHRDDVLAIAEKAGIITSENRDMWANEFYVPFYRLNEDDVKANGPRIAGGLTRQQAYKKLKGGTQELNDLLENTLMNFHHLLDASLKNIAAKQAVANGLRAGVVSKTTEAMKGEQSTFVLVHGQKRFYNVDDPMVFMAITSLGSTGMNSTAMKLMRGFKRVFTNFTTATPQFMVANLIRDSIQAISIADMEKNPAKNVASGLHKWRDSQARARMMATGGAFSFGHAYGENPDDIRWALDKELRSGKLISSPADVAGLIRAGWERWARVGNALENANRTAAFDQNVKEKGKLYAAHQARDLMDFSAHGAWPAVRILIDIVPFLNARLQGLDKLYRSGVKPSTAVIREVFGGPGASDSDWKAARRFGAVVGAYTLASIALYLHNMDDDEYKKLEDWQKDTYNFVRIGDNGFFIPKAFEIGAIATLGERLTEQLVDDKVHGKLFAERLGHMLSQTFAFSPVPQMGQPLLDLYANKDAFTGRDIETTGMERMSPEMRVRADTSNVAKLTSSMMAGTFGTVLGSDSALVLSPVQIDHLIQGYLGQIGASAVAMSDVAVNYALGKETPSKAWTEYQPIKRFYRDLSVPGYDRYQTLFYDALRQSERTYADINELRRQGEMEKAAELAAESHDKLAMRKALSRIQGRLTALNARAKAVQASSKSGDEKRAELDRIKVMKERLILSVSDYLDRAS